ncbi:hypothetical protein ASF28_18630 [Methylobacterium sp. Leaf99]|uniref:hypothetical protein n=1 Tax=Methylobacterium sp. Leaf99 TaxID=1736251 RepID=UPI00071618CE|nr:hypothetical protein [Methylobacterium sp. Leaf99]KQP05905.1 hypothetical protein ASF28_18630 [Methylobacterium sp. Leaf99]
MTAPRHDSAGLVARIRAGRAEVDALRAVLRDREAEVYRLCDQLGRLPSNEPAPALRSPQCIPIKQAARIAKCSVYTLRRHGKPGGWAWKAGGRWGVDPAGLDDWMRGREAAS